MHNKKLLKCIILLMVLPVFCLSEIQAQVIINEICWTGTQSSTTDEWIELYNHSSSAVDLSGWSIQAADGSPEIVLSGSIGSHSYYLLERSDDQTISDISADIIYTGSLGNSG
ncbi:MAG: lamin tail domain-containing protein, partial [bacterium]